jgi:hypothetical protein
MTSRMCANWIGLSDGLHEYPKAGVTMPRGT